MTFRIGILRNVALDRIRPRRCFERLAKVLELLGAHIADGAQIEASLRPKVDVDPPHGLHPRAVLRLRILRNEQIDEVVASAIHDRCDRLPEHIVDPPADQAEALPGQVGTGSLTGCRARADPSLLCTSVSDWPEATPRCAETTRSRELILVRADTAIRAALAAAADGN